MSSVDVYNTTELKSASSRVLREIDEVMNRCETTVLSSSRPNKTIIQTRLKTLLDVRPTQDLPLDRRLHELIISYALLAEKQASGACDLCISLITRGLHDVFKGLPRQNNIKSLECILSDCVQHGRAHHVRSMIDDIMDQKNAYIQMLSVAIELAGFKGRIIIEKTKGEPHVELISGHTFNLSPAIDVDVCFSQACVVTIDGFIESIGEINALLTDANVSKQPVLLCFRGAANDVLSTLKMNYDRGSLAVIPVIVPFDLDGINTLKDIATVSGSEIVSSEKGQLICSIRLNDLSMIRSFSIKKNSLVIINDDARSAVDLLVADLRRRRDLQQTQDGQKIYDERLITLMSSHVVLRIHDDVNFVMMSQTIDGSLRALRSLIERGITKNGELAATVIAAHVQAERCLRVIESLGAAVI